MDKTPNTNLTAAAQTAGLYGTVTVTLPDGAYAVASARDIIADAPGQTIRIQEPGRGVEFFWASQLTAV